MTVRRVVTGRTAEGTSIVASDEAVDPITAALLPGGGFYKLWGSDEPLTLPQSGAPPAAAKWFPAPEGFRFAVVVFGPEAVAPAGDLDRVQAAAELAEKLPGLIEVVEPDNPAMHTTDTVDFGVVLAGEIWLELDDGVETLLEAGDCVVQNGTRHAWHNRSSEPCTLAVAMVGAAR